ncbi:hypothetical protein P154DRAFT_271068 [Amniculicola lignicola CBS 123094]|uniref:Uncharacterized protein n=1 Tax=Amniculicola lignicola CBS 123094 TaxID=1392246 RepID=A0A6A5WA16_9PLEO|nr:hypothetical protein P154DRAFT_271068 [Amniculicola lignicola CBS 123094]
MLKQSRAIGAGALRRRLLVVVHRRIWSRWGLTSGRGWDWWTREQIMHRVLQNSATPLTARIESVQPISARTWRRRGSVVAASADPRERASDTPPKLCISLAGRDSHGTALLPARRPQRGTRPATPASPWPPGGQSGSHRARCRDSALGTGRTLPLFFLIAGSRRHCAQKQPSDIAASAPSLGRSSARSRQLPVCFFPISILPTGTRSCMSQQAVTPATGRDRKSFERAHGLCESNRPPSVHDNTCRRRLSRDHGFSIHARCRARPPLASCLGACRAGLVIYCVHQLVTMLPPSQIAL